MAYLLTSATGVDDLLNQLGVFAAANGWTVQYNASGQLGVYKGDCKVALGKRTSTPDINRQMLRSGGTVVDTPIAGTLCTAFSGTDVFSGHTGAPALTVNYVWTNDWNGPFTEVHFLSGADNDYIHVFARTVATSPRIDDRWSCLSFGFLDQVGMSGPKIPYLTGTWFEFWENSSSPTSNNYSPNRPSSSGSFPSNAQSTSGSASTGHSFAFGAIGNGSQLQYFSSHFGIISGFLDESIFASPPSVAYGQLGNRHVHDKNSNIRSTTPYAMVGDIANFASPQLTVLGNTLIPAMCFYGTSHNLPLCFLGQYPGMRWFDMTNLSAAEEFEVNTDTWIVFPFKQKNSESEVANTGPINTWKYGYAILKE